MAALCTQVSFLAQSSFRLRRYGFCSEKQPKSIKSVSEGLNLHSHCTVFAKERKHHRSISSNLLVSVAQFEPSDNGKDEINEIFEGLEVKKKSSSSSLIAKLAVALGIAVTITLASVLLKQSSDSSSLGSHLNFPKILDASSESPSPLGYTLTLFGKKLILPERTPGWVYFWLLMAAGCGLFVSEEALNVWVGISLGRTLTLDGTWQSLSKSFCGNASYIISTVLWVYWGVCISDMIPFYLGKLFKESKASEDIYNKLGIGKDKVLSLTRMVRNYGNLSGFVERFSLGVRNPTAFLAGACGISADCFFAGVCGGGLITLSIQLALGFLLRERPVVALASVAAFVGMWTIFPYILAGSTAVFLLFRRTKS